MRGRLPFAVTALGGLDFAGARGDQRRAGGSGCWLAWWLAAAAARRSRTSWRRHGVSGSASGTSGFAGGGYLARMASAFSALGGIVVGTACRGTGAAELREDANRESSVSGESGGVDDGAAGACCREVRAVRLVGLGRPYFRSTAADQPR